MEFLEIRVENKFYIFLGLFEMSCVCLCYLYFLFFLWFLGLLCYFSFYLVMFFVEMLKYFESGSVEIVVCSGGGSFRVDL